MIDILSNMLVVEIISNILSGELGTTEDIQDLGINNILANLNYQANDEIEEVNIFEVTPSEGSDVIHGNDDKNIISAADGDDIVYGHGGDDEIKGGLGNDILHGQLDNDFVYGDEDNDILLGGDGSDLLRGDLGNDNIYGGAGDDFITGDAGDDIIFGGTDNGNLEIGNYEFLTNLTLDVFGQSDINIEVGSTDVVFDNQDRLFGGEEETYLFMTTVMVWIPSWILMLMKIA